MPELSSFSTETSASVARARQHSVGDRLAMLSPRGLAAAGALALVKAAPLARSAASSS